MKYCFSIAIFLTSLTAAVVAQAQSPEQPDVIKAKILFEKGETAYRLGEFREALAQYKSALAIVQRPSIVLNIGQCYRQLGEIKRALFYYRLYLADWARAHPQEKSPYGKEVSAHIVELEKKLAAQKAERDKAIGGSTPATKPTSASVEVDAPMGAPSMGTPSTGGPLTANDDLLRRRRSKSIWAYTTLGVGLAAAVAGACVVGAGYFRQREHYDSYKAANDQGHRNELWGEVEQAQDMIVAGYITGGVAAIVLGVSAYQFITRPELKKGAKAPLPMRSVAIVPTNTGGHFVLTGRF
jgi:tetratricopeptide (TPR) repeat protein